ncbi:MAG: TolC family protein [Pseudomonadota bacterium]
MANSPKTDSRSLSDCFGIVVRRRNTGRALIYGMVSAVLAWGLCTTAVVQAADTSPGGAGTYGYFDFATCVRHALVHSEHLIKSRLDIQIQSTSLKDAHSELVPSFGIQTLYYLARTGGQGVESSPFSVRIYMGAWNPYLTLLKIKSQEILVDIARITHEHKITEGIARIAKLFYEIHCVENAVRVQKEAIALYRKRIDYVETLKDRGKSDDISDRVAKIQLRSEELRLKGLETRKETAVRELKTMIGYQPDFYLPLDIRDAPNQILGGFNSGLIAFSDIQGNNLQLKIQAKREQVQSNTVTGAYVNLVPQPLFFMETLANQVDRSSGLNMSLGLNYTIWDGFFRVREIKRQKMLAFKAKMDRHELSRRLYNEYRTLKTRLDMASEKEALQKEQLNVAELQEERAFLSYKSGALSFSDYLTARIQTAQNNLSYMDVLQERVSAMIDLATVAGGMNKYNARIGL